MLRALEESLRGAGFQTAALEESRVLFNLAAVREDRRVIVKVVENVDSVRKSTLLELAETARRLEAEAYLVALREAKGPLLDGTLYRRYGVPAMSPRTFLEYVTEEVLPAAEARKGGVYVPIDGMALRAKREEMGISLGSLSRVLGVSRRTILKYEEGMDATPEVAIKLVEIFGPGVLRGARPTLEEAAEDVGRRLHSGEELLRGILDLGLEVFYSGRRPLEMVASSRGRRIIANICVKKGMVEKARMLSKFGRLMREPHALLMRDRMGRKRAFGVPLLDLEDLRSLERGDELWDIISERTP